MIRSSGHPNISGWFGITRALGSSSSFVSNKCEVGVNSLFQLIPSLTYQDRCENIWSVESGSCNLNDSWKSNFLVATDAMDQREGSCSQIEEESRLQENKVFQETSTWNIPWNDMDSHDSRNLCLFKISPNLRMWWRYYKTDQIW